jgi:single-strand DNA-binding protein
MANETTLTIVGNLTGDPEMRVTPSGASMTRFTVASTPRTYDKASGAWKDGEALFLSCTAWRDLAENVAESVSKGARVIVSGRLRQHRWEDNETGEKRSMMQLDVEEVGVSLRFATATVNGVGTDTPPDDPFATAAPVGTGTPSSFDDTPPF